MVHLQNFVSFVVKKLKRFFFLPGSDDGRRDFCSASDGQTGSKTKRQSEGMLWSKAVH